jgi:hypothetical protein
MAWIALSQAAALAAVPGRILAMPGALGQVASGGAERYLHGTLWMLGTVSLLAALLAAAGWLVHRTVRRGLDRSDAVPPPFTLAQLRSMHREGQLSDAEYARARAQLLARSRLAGGDTVPAQTAGDGGSGPAAGGDSDKHRGDQAM